jgi:hypothetical protein
MTFDADNNGGGYEPFKALCEKLAGGVPQGVTVGRAYLSDTPLNTARAQLQQGFRDGSLLVTYAGHSGLDRMAQEGLLTSADVPSLGNGDRLPVVLSLSCTMGRFCIPGYDALGENLVLQSGGGAIAVWAPSGMSVDQSAAVLGEAFHDALQNSGQNVLGEVMLTALGTYHASQATKYLPGIYNLLGDPALRIVGRTGAGYATTLAARGGPAACAFENWIARAFGNSPGNGPLRTLDADPDGDGAPNLLEYAMGGRPDRPDAESSLRLETAEVENGDHDLVLVFKRRKNAGDIIFRMETTDDLTSGWRDGSRYIRRADVRDNGDGETETVRWYVYGLESERGACFIRLKAARRP